MADYHYLDPLQNIDLSVYWDLRIEASVFIFIPESDLALDPMKTHYLLLQ